MKEAGEVVDEFFSFVNMTPDELEEWLATDESKTVGLKKENRDTVIGAKSGHRIVEILNKDDYTHDDVTHMRKVVAYIKKNMGQRSGNVVACLKNCGHDPLTYEE